MGAAAGAFAAAATTPLDVIKTNMMCTAASRPTMMSSARAVLAQGGPSQFFRCAAPSSEQATGGPTSLSVFSRSTAEQARNGAQAAEYFFVVIKLFVLPTGFEHWLLPAGVWGRAPSATASTRRCSSASLRRCAGPSRSARPWCAQLPLTPGAVLQHAGRGAE